MTVTAVVVIALADHSAAPDRSARPPASTVPSLTAPLPSRPTRRLLIREDSHEHHRAPARLLSAFAALRDPVPRTRGGATVSDPPLSAIPTQVLELASPRRRNQIDNSRMRRVALRSGIDVSILPGARSLCTAVAAPVHGQGTLVWGDDCGPAGPAERVQEKPNIEHGSEGDRRAVAVTRPNGHDPDPRPAPDAHPGARRLRRIQPQALTRPPQGRGHPDNPYPWYLVACRATLCYVRQPLSLRLAAQTLERLGAQARRAHMPPRTLAQRYVEEGLRMDEHPLVRFVDGPAGRRARLVGSGLDVWETIATVRDNDGDLAAAAAYLEIAVGLVQAAVGYYGAYQTEIDDWIEFNEQEAADAHAAWRAGQAALKR